jgi:hypothetical protein
MISLPRITCVRRRANKKKTNRRGSYKFTARTNKNTKVACTQIPWKQEEIQQKVERKMKRQLKKQKRMLQMW